GGLRSQARRAAGSSVRLPATSRPATPEAPVLLAGAHERRDQFLQSDGTACRGLGRGSDNPGPPALSTNQLLVEPSSVLAHLVAGHVVLRDRVRAAVRGGRRTGAARVHATGDTAVLIERRSGRRGGTAGLGRRALTQAGLRGLP